MKKVLLTVCMVLLMVGPAVHAADMTDLLKALPAIPSGSSVQDSGTVASGLRESEI